jgi:hypothetical protein
MDISPYPASLFVLSGLSLGTLIYVTYANRINKIPGKVKEQLVSAGQSASAVGASIQKSATELITPAAPGTQPAQGEGIVAGITNTLSSLNPFGPSAPAAPAAPVNPPPPGEGVVTGITNTLSSLNPFGPAKAEAPVANAPPKIGGSKKRKSKKSKKTKRSHR